ncbi:hypothetical protein [Streptomyces europaeiscabiei]|uniref:hypothetical protein n=1 Tax=Streptomyces europaeiscabiei TaxID=146819 RepID=UPI0029A62B47|nr:hypothetical protein [Streptomyces europaeiscabiei]MDX3614477.1 hypothetical protein [Streptomyces europaeiscabiei]
MKSRKSAVASIVAAGVALTPGTAGTASASSRYSAPGGQVKFTPKGEILKVWDLKAGRTGPPRPRPRPLREEPDLSAKNPTTDWCEAKGKSKTCDMKFKGWKDKA